MSGLRELLWWAGSFVAYCVLVWLLAPQLLSGPLGGNDIPYALGYASWIARAFPAMPFWFPYQGGGVSPSAAYAIAPLYAVAALHRAGLDLVVATRVLAFVAMALGALGVAAFARALGLRHLGAFLAGAFSLLPPAQWNLLVLIGIYANAIAASLAPWAAAALVAYGRYPHARLDRRGALLFAGAAATVALTFVAHQATSVVPLALGALVAASAGARAIVRTAAASAAALLLAAGPAYAFLEYARLVEGPKELLRSDLASQLIPPEVLAGLADQVPGRTLLDGLSLTPFLLAGGVAGAAVAWRHGVHRSLVIAAATCAVFLLSLDAQVLVARALAPLSPALSFRGWLIFFAIALAILTAVMVETLFLRARRAHVRTVALFGLAVAIVVLEGVGYGPHAAGDAPFARGRLLDLVSGRSALRWDGVSTELAYRLDATEELAEQLMERGPRADISPENADILGLTMLPGARVVMLYTNYLSLFYRSWSDLRLVLYHDHQLGVLGSSVSESAAWFGLSRVALMPDEDRERFSREGWAVTRGPRFVFADPPFRSTLAAWRERGVALHVGRRDRDAYANMYRFASAGALPFATAWLVQGPPCVDDIASEDLRRFDAIILEDHCARDEETVARRLLEFVNRGGRLFVESGWEGSPYAASATTPSFLPIAATAWGPVGTEPTLALERDLVPGGTAVQSFGDFRYADGTWDLSSSTPVRPWARPVLSAGDRVLVAAGRLGTGRVVWSGMNLVQHAWQKGRVAERTFAAELMAWLLEDATTRPQELETSVVGDDAAEVRSPNGGWLLWRESPAYAQVTPAPVSRLYRAGPGMLLTRVEAGTYRISQGPSLPMRAAAMLGGVALALLGLWLARALAAGGVTDPVALPLRWTARGHRRQEESSEPDAGSEPGA